MQVTLYRRQTGRERRWRTGQGQQFQFSLVSTLALLQAAIPLRGRNCRKSAPSVVHERESRAIVVFITAQDRLSGNTGKLPAGAVKTKEAESPGRPVLFRPARLESPPGYGGSYKRMKAPGASRRGPTKNMCSWAGGSAVSVHKRTGITGI